MEKDVKKTYTEGTKRNISVLKSFRSHFIVAGDKSCYVAPAQWAPIGKKREHDPAICKARKICEMC
jgi:hypothetical protein